MRSEQEKAPETGAVEELLSGVATGAQDDPAGEGPSGDGPPEGPMSDADRSMLETLQVPGEGEPVEDRK
jgi:hypothetical protein